MFNRTLTGPLLATVIVMFNLQPLAAQPGWQKAIGAQGFEKGSSVKLLPDGGYIIAGETESFGLAERDMLLIRTDAQGNPLWTKTYGGPERETVNEVLPVAGGGFLVAAEKYQPNKVEGENLTLLMTDATGHLQWKKVYDEGGHETEAFSVQPTPDNHFVMTGMVKKSTVVSDAFFTMSAEDQSLYLIKIDSKGNKTWSRQFSYGEPDVSSTGISVTVAADGSYLITGNLARKGKTDKKIEKPAQQVNMNDVRSALLVKVKPNGTLAWAREIEAGKLAMGYSVVERKDGSILIAGNTSVSATNVDVFVMLLDAKGNLQWAKTYGGPKFESVADIMLTPDGALMVSAMSYSFKNNISEALVFTLDANGNLQWARTYGTENEDYPSKLIANGNQAVMVGSTAGKNSEGFDILLMKMPFDGTGSCIGQNVSLQSAALKTTTKVVSTARMEAVQQGVTPPNMKKPDVANITETNRETRAKQLCK